MSSIQLLSQAVQNYLTTLVLYPLVEKWVKDGSLSGSIESRVEEARNFLNLNSPSLATPLPSLSIPNVSTASSASSTKKTTGLVSGNGNTTTSTGKQLFTDQNVRPASGHCQYWMAKGRPPKYCGVKCKEGDYCSKHKAKDTGASSSSSSVPASQPLNLNLFDPSNLPTNDIPPMPVKTELSIMTRSDGKIVPQTNDSIKLVMEVSPTGVNKIVGVLSDSNNIESDIKTDLNDVELDYIKKSSYSYDSSLTTPKQTSASVPVVGLPQLSSISIPSLSTTVAPTSVAPTVPTPSLSTISNTSATTATAATAATAATPTLTIPSFGGLPQFSPPKF